jgi:hypothetical protein
MIARHVRDGARGEEQRQPSEVVGACDVPERVGGSSDCRDRSWGVREPAHHAAWFNFWYCRGGLDRAPPIMTIIYRPFSIIVAACCAVLAVASLCWTSAALAKAKPHTTLTLPAAGAEAGAKVAYSWTATHVHGGRLLVQRPEGTGHVWRTIAVLKGSRGSGSLPALSLGVYQFRIVNVASRNQVLAQQQHQLRVFGQVTFATLLGNPSGGVYTSATSAFPWVVMGDWFENETGRSSEAFSIPATNTCRTVHVEFTDHIYASSVPNPTVTISVVQQSSDPVSTTVPPNIGGTVDATVVPGQPWSVVLTSTVANNGNLYFNGYADCYSAVPAVS